MDRVEVDRARDIEDSNILLFVLLVKKVCVKESFPNVYKVQKVSKQSANVFCGDVKRDFESIAKTQEQQNRIDSGTV